MKALSLRRLLIGLQESSELTSSVVPTVAPDACTADVSKDGVSDPLVDLVDGHVLSCSQQPARMSQRPS